MNTVNIDTVGMSPEQVVEAIGKAMESKCAVRLVRENIVLEPNDLERAKSLIEMGHRLSSHAKSRITNSRWEKARSKGEGFGRRVLTHEQRAEAAAMVKAGASVLSVSRHFGCSCRAINSAVRHLAH